MSMSICKNIVGIHFASSCDIFLVLIQIEKVLLNYFIFEKECSSQVESKVVLASSQDLRYHVLWN